MSAGPPCQNRRWTVGMQADYDLRQVQQNTQSVAWLHTPRKTTQPCNARLCRNSQCSHPYCLKWLSHTQCAANLAFRVAGGAVVWVVFAENGFDGGADFIHGAVAIKAERFYRQRFDIAGFIADRLALFQLCGRFTGRR